MEVETSDEATRSNKKPNTTNQTRAAILVFLSQHHKNGRLCNGAAAEAELKFGVSNTTVRRIWTRGREGVLDPSKSVDVSSRKKGRCGRKSKWADKISHVSQIPLHDRQTLDRFSYVVGIPKTSLWRLLKNGHLKRHTSSLKPLLTDSNKEERVKFCLSFVQDNNLFDDMYSYVHIDEKWFYITRINQKFYLLPDEAVGEGYGAEV